MQDFPTSRCRILPMGTSTCGLEEWRVEPLTISLVDDELNLLSRLQHLYEQRENLRWLQVGAHGPLLIMMSFVMGRYVQVGKANIALCNIEVGNPCEIFGIPAHLLKRAELHNDSYSYSYSTEFSHYSKGDRNSRIFNCSINLQTAVVSAR